MKQILTKLYDYQTLSADQASELFRSISLGRYNDAQIASLMTVYLMRNITLEELSGFRDALLEFRKPIDFGTHDFVDIVGTGGDGKDTFNISSCASVVVAGAGYRVVKHGNYGASSISGASNVMENFGVRFTDSEQVHKRSLQECNLAYLHAPVFNSAMKAVANVRRAMGVRSFFNMLGPLINPAQPNFQLLGVYNLAMQRMYSYILQRDNVHFAVVHSLDGCDEISLTSSFQVATSEQERIYSPNELGFPSVHEQELYSGDTPQQAAKIFEQVLTATATPAQRNAVVANAAFAISLLDSSLSLEACIDKAKESIDSGRAMSNFKRFIEINR